MTGTCISLVVALKQHVFDGDGAALLAEWKALTDKDKRELRDAFIAEGVEIAPLAA